MAFDRADLVDFVGGVGVRPGADEGAGLVDDGDVPLGAVDVDGGFAFVGLPVGALLGSAHAAALSGGGDCCRGCDGGDGQEGGNEV